MINPASTNTLYDQSMVLDDTESEYSRNSKKFPLIGKPQEKEGEITPIKPVKLDQSKIAAYKEKGQKLIAEGEVCLVLYAGQSVLMEHCEKEEPLGMCDIGLPSCKTPYQVVIERFITA